MPRATFDTVLGRCGLAWGEHGLTRFWLPEARPQPDDVEMPADIAAIAARVQRHLRGELQSFGDVTFDFAPLPEFLVAVLRETLAIPPGVTRSYGQIAAACGQPPAASRAVGRALGENPWPLLIPCHRVISASGKMTGFSGPGGITTKLKLLALEGAELFPT